MTYVTFGRKAEENWHHKPIITESSIIDHDHQSNNRCKQIDRTRYKGRPWWYNRCDPGRASRLPLLVMPLVAGPDLRFHRKSNTNHVRWNHPTRCLLRNDGDITSSAAGNVAPMPPARFCCCLRPTFGSSRSSVKIVLLWKEWCLRDSRRVATRCP
jgi:hypothetical protein